MTNNDIFKKLRVALMLRDDQIVEILELVDFRITKSEIGAFFRDEKHENYVECGDQILRNFLNGLVIHLRGTKENPKNPNDVLAKHRSEIPKKTSDKPKTEFKTKTDFKKKPASNNKKVEPKVQVVEKVRFNNGKAKK
ncbi:DUF1456 family protein [Flavobacterium psychrophilum]|uniref:DUF1456 family protein n=1 Tax=Flavobacterium psychrophilum TaxID=96345 RepID=UPI0004F808D9|nr:DUF1456 family protein [Flavobacterium psychrophilum]AIN74642.1 hypothetical protein FPG3_10275 [Flavobacterium psychrophilum FPG3]EKT2070434.1 DUF1456 family protein [Flavobacterium psychrophilum]EKT2072537.1 DUF1456 family protein [Flavobacterium psychrophilum]EKT4491967.1 DUF1456 family protein [Flavobacterium psychrophilum]MBF2044407.1 DUF1456 family protein [Flavobacterium psychrophilum]